MGTRSSQHPDCGAWFIRDYVCIFHEMQAFYTTCGEWRIGSFVNQFPLVCRASFIWIRHGRKRTNGSGHRDWAESHCAFFEILTNLITIGLFGNSCQIYAFFTLPWREETVTGTRFPWT